METVFIKLAAADVSVTALAQYLRQLAGGHQVLQPGASARHQLAAYEDLRDSPVTRHGLHHVHHHLAVLALLVDLVALELSSEVPE